MSAIDVFSCDDLLWSIIRYSEDITGIRSLVMSCKSIWEAYLRYAKAERRHLLSKFIETCIIIHQTDPYIMQYSRYKSSGRIYGHAYIGHFTGRYNYYDTYIASCSGLKLLYVSRTGTACVRSWLTREVTDMLINYVASVASNKAELVQNKKHVFKYEPNRASIFHFVTITIYVQQYTPNCIIDAELYEKYAQSNALNS